MNAVLKDSTDPRIEQLFATITDLNHVANINRDAFNDIAKTLLSFHDDKDQLNIRNVCNASMGHGKSTVLTAYLKWITKQNNKQPVLIALREKQLAHEIYTAVSEVSPDSIIKIDADNKNLYSSNLHKYQIIIIQHERLKNLSLDFGDAYKYSYYERDKAGWGTSNQTERIKRLLIIDEKPDFIDSAIFDIISENNVLEWFDDLSKPFQMLPRTMQKYKSYIIYKLSEQLADNTTDVTTALLTEDDLTTTIATDVINTLNKMKEHIDNKTKYDSLNKLKHFKNLLIKDGYGRIDDYSFGKIGRKIIVSEYIDYSKLGMNILIFDGTASATHRHYTKGGFKAKQIVNRNDYSRLTLHNDRINTSLYSRNKKGNPTQAAIAGRIKEIQKEHNNVFVLPMKDEIKLYINEGAITEANSHYYFGNEDNQTKGINLLNTVGKNILNDTTNLYLTSLPKKNSDHYKQIAIALYGNDVFLLTSEDNDNSNWFQDEKLESVYRGDLYSELLQIIHRTALRKIDKKDEINIYMAYDDEPISYHERETLIEILNRLHFKDQANIAKQHKVIDMTQYGRDETLNSFIKQAHQKLSVADKGVINANSISSSFKKYLQNHWVKNSTVITNKFKDSGLKIYVDENDKRRPKKVKCI